MVVEGPHHSSLTPGMCRFSCSGHALRQDRRGELAGSVAPVPDNLRGGPHRGARVRTLDAEGRGVPRPATRGGAGGHAVGRIHWDDCEESKGALRVLPGTHNLGRLTAAQIAEEQRSRASFACVARTGDVLSMRPLPTHASSVASQAAHRRVIHIDYASSQLEGGLQWLSGVADGLSVSIRTSHLVP